MGQIKLNKPLYAEETAGQGPQEPRPARPMLWARVGAVVIDLLVLHALAMGTIRFFPRETIWLGLMGPWAGLAFGYLYFALSASHLTSGRTAGKAVLRLQTTDIAGPCLPLARAFGRTALLMWPLAAFLALRQIGESAESPDRITLLSSINLTGIALAAGWFFGNTLYAWSDPFGFTWYDRKASSAVVATDSSPESLAEYLREARTTADVRRAIRSRRMLWGAMVAFVALSAFIQWQSKVSYDSIPAADKTRFLEVRKLWAMPGYGQPVPLPAVAATENHDTPTTQTAAADAVTTLVKYRYSIHARVDADALAHDSRAMGASERIVKVLTEELKSDRVPTQGHIQQFRGYGFQATFAEVRDLFFAWESTDIFASNAVALPVDEIVAAQSTGTLEKELPKR